MENTVTKKIQISTENMRYGFDGDISFKDTEGNEYTADHKGAWELAALILEALDMDICERDNLLYKLEEAYEAKQEEAYYVA